MVDWGRSTIPSIHGRDWQTYFLLRDTRDNQGPAS